MADKSFMCPPAKAAILQNNTPASWGSEGRAKQPYINKNTLPSPGTTSWGSETRPRVSDNSFSHQPDNIVTNNGNSDGDNFDNIDLKTVFQSNVLDNYDAVTYHWKFFMVDPETASTGQVFNLNKQTIIAESGVTDLTIDNVEIRGVATPSIESGTGVMTNVKFEIVEPSGAGLIDKMFYQSVALGIGNWATMPVYLQLTFKGRNPEDSAPDDGSPGNLSSLVWVWALKISAIKANVTHVGTRYEFVATLYNEFAQSNANFALLHAVTLNNLKTFKDAMTELEEKLNADQLLRLLSNSSIPDSYRIITDPKLGKALITQINKNTNPVRADNYNELGNKDATFLKGTSIDKIIDTLLSQTDKYQESMLGAATPGADGKPMLAQVSQMKKFWRIITETRPLSFDVRRQTLANEFTIYVIEYDIGVLDNNASQSAAPPLTLAAERKRLLTYINKKILKKKYNYIFTGLNDQILNFDLTINNAFAVAQSRYGGIYNNISMIDKGVVNHKHSAEEAKLTDIIGKAISLQNNAKTVNTAGAESALADAKTAITNSNISADTKSKYITLLGKAKPADRAAFFDDVRAAGGITIDGSLNREKAKATNLARPVTEKITNQQLNFISNVDVGSAEAKLALSDFAKYASGKLRPIARMETSLDRQVGLGVESNSNSGLQKLSSMFSVALHSGLDSSFQHIKLSIKGDPFWLFPQPITDKNSRIFKSLLPDQSAAIELIKNGHKLLTESVNTYGTDNFLLIRFRSPRIYNIDENQDSSNPNADVETFSGVFKVTTVTNRFLNGKFEQDLECILDPEIRVLNILDQIETDAKTPNKPTSLNNLTTPNIIPATAITTKKILAGNSNLIEGFVARTPLTDASTFSLSSIGRSALSSNVPISLPNIIPGLPNTFG